MEELIGSRMVSCLLFSPLKLYLLLYFRLPSTFLPSKARSIITLGTRWHDFFYYPFQIFYKFALFFLLEGLLFMPWYQ